MKFAHLSDLHIGMTLYKIRLLEDQEYILNEILKILEKERPDGLLICGDIYDRPIPPEDAVKVFDNFLWRVNQLNIDIYMTSGNHDSAIRLNFGGKMFAAASVFVEGDSYENIRFIEKEDEYGKIRIYMLPFIKPRYIKNALGEMPESYDFAVREVVKNIKVDKSIRNIIMAHQFIQGATLNDSGKEAMGYLDAIGVDIFDDFDYVALGHLHRSQKVKREEVRYCGSPLKYSFTETKNEKSVTFFEIKEKGNIEINRFFLKPLRDMKILKGSFNELIKSKSDDYIHIILTDKKQIHFAYARLSYKYPNIMNFEYEDLGYTQIKEKELALKKELNTKELFALFYEKQVGKKMSADEEKIINDLIEMEEI